VSIRLRHVYFDDDGTIHLMSQARYDRIFAPHTREAVPERANRRVRFLTLYVWLEDSVPLEVSRAEGSLVTFDDDGRRDLADAERERRAAVGLLDQSHRPSTSGVISAAARFESAGFRGKPTRAELEAAISVHRLRGR
jgi:hypothetical protein